MTIVRAAALAGYVTLVENLGGDADALLRQRGLTRGDLLDPDRHLPYLPVVQLIEDAAHVLRQPDFALRLVEAQDISFLGVLALAIQSAPTVRAALLLGTRHVSYHAPALRYESVPATDAALGGLELIVLHNSERAALELPQAAEHALGHFVQLVRVLSNNGIQPAAIQFRHAQQGSDAQYRRHLGQLPRFGQASDAVAMQPLPWRQPLASHNPVLQDFVERFLLGAAPQPQLPLIEQVQQVLATLLHAGGADLESVARVLRRHPRTLQRGLKAAGTSFDTLRDEARRDWVRQLLAQTDLSLTQIAASLGFADQSVLTRAVRRWFGHSPRELRRGLEVAR